MKRKYKMPSIFTRSPSRAKDYLLITSFVIIVYLLFYRPPPHPPPLLLSRSEVTDKKPHSPLTRHNLLFSIASSATSYDRRLNYICLWYDQTTTRAVSFLDRNPTYSSKCYNGSPQIVISGDTARFPYTFPRGRRSAIRVARVVKEAVELNLPDVKWFVFGDDDTVFVVDNLVKTLEKYDHDKWFYIGSNSESYEQNSKDSFEMAFGGGGFVISASLARVLARVFDSCLMRYPHLYGSDGRVFSCLAELGVSLTHEPGFHQVDMRGNLFGMFMAHPLSPLVSLHHLDAVDPFFPKMNNTEALDHLFKAVNIDPARILQQTVCYDRLNNLTVSVSWGYAIQVVYGNELLPDLLALQKTFRPWRRGAKVDAYNHFMFNMRDYPRDPSKRPLTFFLESVVADNTGVQSNYINHDLQNSPKGNPINKLARIRVFSQKLKLDIEKMKAPRRQCCDVTTSTRSMVVNIRECGGDELISMTV
ncbi:hypothetical protein ACFE04_018066 [Oxalis oulophora]